MDDADEDLVEYVNTLRVAILEAYTGIIQVAAGALSVCNVCVCTSLCLSICMRGVVWCMCLQVLLTSLCTVCACVRHQVLLGPFISQCVVCFPACQCSASLYVCVRACVLLSISLKHVALYSVPQALHLYSLSSHLTYLPSPSPPYPSSPSR